MNFDQTLRWLCAILLVCGASASAQNTAEELFEVGFSYQTGEGVELDEQRALSYYGDALRLKPELFAPLYNSALIYHGRGEYTRDRKSTRLNSSHSQQSRMPSSA